jgi:hypothetical protein
MLPLFLARLTVSLALLASPTPVISDAELQKQLDSHRAARALPHFDSVEERPWEVVRLPNPLLLVIKSSDAMTADTATLVLKTQYGLRQEAARDLLVFLLFAHRPGNHQQGTDRETEGIEAGLASVAEAPEALAPILALLTLRTPVSKEPQFRARVLSALEATPNPEALAQQALKAQRSESWAPVLASFLAGRSPVSLRSVLPRSTYDLPIHLGNAFELAAYRALTTAEKSGDAGQALGRRLLRNLLENSQPSLALAVLGIMPEDARNALSENGDLPPDGTPADQLKAPGYKGVDLRTLIAAAYFDVKNLAAAKRWLAAAPPELAPAECGPRVARRLLADAIGGPEDSSFDLFVASRTCHPLPGNPWALIEASVLGKEYPRHVRERMLSFEKELGEDESSPLLAQLPFTKQAVAELARGRADALSASERRLGANTAESARTPSSVAMRRLAVPPFRAFSERKTADLPSPTVPKVWKPLPSSSLKLPDGFRPVRAEQNGSRMVVVALSQRLDPTGEVSGGGYWLLISDDAGATWGAPVYTGLRALRPYELVTDSKWPILDGSVVQLEASRRELDERSITFPPVALRTSPSVEGILLVSKLETLRLDSDGDGLTDVVEDRLLLDPNNADSDGDGIPDGRDMVPHIPNTRAVSRDSELLSELLFRLTDARPPGIEPGVHEDGGTPSTTLRSPEAAVDALYLEMGEPIGAERAFPVRIIVLTHEELVLARKRFGTFYPMRLDVFFSKTHDEALIEWNEGWRGGTYRARWNKGWELKPLSTWIT